MKSNYVTPQVTFTTFDEDVVTASVFEGFDKDWIED